MTPAPPDPILRAPPCVTARGGVTVRGRGWVVLRLGPGAEVRARLPATVAYTFTGAGAVRVPRADERVFVGPPASAAGADAPAGRLEVRGEALALEVVHGDVTIALTGTFDLTLGARAELIAGDGARFPGRAAGRSLRVDGARVGDAGPRPQAGGAAA